MCPGNTLSIFDSLAGRGAQWDVRSLGVGLRIPRLPHWPWPPLSNSPTVFRAPGINLWEICHLPGFGCRQRRIQENEKDREREGKGKEETRRGEEGRGENLGTERKTRTGCSEMGLRFPWLHPGTEVQSSCLCFTIFSSLRLRNL